MKRPETFEGFKTLLQTMEHRERLLFVTNDGLMLEIYFTIVINDKDMFNENATITIALNCIKITTAKVKK